MKITSPKLEASNLSLNERALLRCQSALELKDKGEYERAKEVLRPIWRGLVERPETSDLHPSVAAEVLLCVGILTGWIGSRHEIKQAQEAAKNLITESITYYESVGDVRKIAAARAEIAYCYWREGALNEARIMLSQALEKLTAEGNTRARALLKLAVVEWTASRYTVALEILTTNAPLFNKLTNYTTKGTYHNQLAIVLRYLASADKSREYLQRAITEFEKADQNFKAARNNVFRASVKNNVGLILLNQGRFKESHKYLAEARRLSASVRDKVRIAEIDESRAQVLIAEKKFKDAAATAGNAVSVLEKSGQRCLLADALTTHGIALARLRKRDQAQYTFQRAIEVAHQVGALNKAGIAALTLIEEIEDLSSETLHAAYYRASEWLATSQSRELLLRLNAAARRVLLSLRTETKASGAAEIDSTENLMNKPCDLQAEVLKYEGVLIRHTLAKVSGSVTRAASLLGMSYQGLAYVIQARHKDLLKERSPIRRRTRKD